MKLPKFTPDDKYMLTTLGGLIVMVAFLVVIAIQSNEIRKLSFEETAKEILLKHMQEENLAMLNKKDQMIKQTNDKLAAEQSLNESNSVLISEYQKTTDKLQKQLDKKISEKIKAQRELDAKAMNDSNEAVHISNAGNNKKHMMKRLVQQNLNIKKTSLMKISGMQKLKF